MQINTLNPDGTGTRGGPLPRASAAPPGAAYSGLLECPCTTRVVKDVNRSTINGKPFHPDCSADAWTSDLLATHNPTCSVATYAGGMECCRDNDVLLDADQPQPEHEDDVRFKWRFYHEEYAPARHTPLVHLEWAVNGCDSGGPRGNPKNCVHIEYDAVQAPEGTPPEKAVHTVTSHFRVRDMLAPDCDPITDEYCASASPARLARPTAPPRQGHACLSARYAVVANSASRPCLLASRALCRCEDGRCCGREDAPHHGGRPLPLARLHRARAVEYGHARAHLPRDAADGYG